MTKKKELTEEEKALIPVFYEKYLNQHTEQVPFEDVQKAVNLLWAELNHGSPTVVLCDSPNSCRDQCLADGHSLNDFDTYWATWFTAYSAMYDFANTIGVEMDQKKLELFLAWGRCCPFILFAKAGDKVYVSRNPIELYLDENKRLHNDNGMAVRYNDGWGVYVLNNVRVDEQIVMRPETQTVEQIRGEDNAEIKRLRIERYGWSRYFKDIGAKLIHSRQNDIEATKEFLWSGDDMKLLMAVCPSTRKTFALEVRDDITTCEEAQAYLSAGFSNRIISAS
jgi:hypothetical protein